MYTFSFIGSVESNISLYPMVIPYVKQAIIKNNGHLSVNRIMRLAKYLLIPWFSLALYTILSVYNGAAGLIAYQELLHERERILENLYQLQTINMELKGSMDALLYDPETIMIRARELGYGESGENFVRIVGVPGVRQRELRPGMIRTAVLPQSKTAADWAAHRTIALSAGFLLLSLFLLMDLIFKPESDGMS